VVTRVDGQGGTRQAQDAQRRPGGERCANAPHRRFFAVLHPEGGQASLGHAIILVTSLESEDDKRRGIESGADAYITKGSFDQGNLLATIRQLL